MTERMFKVLVVGDSGVGKTAFVNQYVSGHYKGITKQTFGGDEGANLSVEKIQFMPASVARMLQLRLHSKFCSGATQKQ